MPLSPALQAVLRPQTWQDFVLATKPAGFWRLGEASGNAIDLGAVKADGTYTASPTRNAAGLVKGDANGAVTLAAASSQWISVADSNLWSIDTTGQLSVHAIFNLATLRSGGNNGMIASKTAGAGEWALYQTDTTGELTWIIYTAAYGAIAFVQSAALVTATTYTVMATVDLSAQSLKLYLNGLQVASSTSFSGTYANAAGVLDLGSMLGGTAHFLDGTLDEVAIWNRVWSPSQVYAFYQKARTLSPALRLAA